MFTKKKTTLDGVTIYIDEKNWSNYYAESYYLYRNHLNYLSHKISKYKAFNASSQRKDFFAMLSNACKQNGDNINKIVSVLKDNVTVSTYEGIRINPTDSTESTLKDFVYLRRDWCFLEESENQLKTIIDSIKNEVNSVTHDKNHSLFIGCGVGRIAHEFTDTYEKVYATDKSFSMIWHLQKLLDGESIRFYNPQYKNIYRLENVAQCYKAKIPANMISRSKGKFQAFVSDVLDLPLKSKSVNSIFSIYFTDVIALKLWFQQIDDKLSDGGLFVHFGPLDYFFSDEREMLTAEEIRAFFENYGYTTLVDKIIETPHLEDSNSISYKVYKNWLFISQKGETKVKHFAINSDTILELRSPIQYERKGVLKDGVIEEDVSIKLPKGVFTGADSVIEVLKLINGKRTFKQIVIQLQKKGFDIDNSDEIKGLLLDFINQDVLKMKKL